MVVVRDQEGMMMDQFAQAAGDLEAIHGGVIPPTMSIFPARHHPLHRNVLFTRSQLTIFNQNTPIINPKTKPANTNMLPGQFATTAGGACQALGKAGPKAFLLARHLVFYSISRNYYHD